MSARRRSRLRRLRQMAVPVAPIVSFVAGTTGGATAQSDGTKVYLQGTPDSRTLAHELAHNLDSQVLTDSDRRRFGRIMGHGKQQWSAKAGQLGGADNSERFADMVSMLQTQRYPKPGQGGGYAYLDNPPTLKRLLRFGRTLDRVQARNGLADYDEKAIREQALRELLAQRKATVARRR